MISALIVNHYATLHELETVYSYEDMLNLYECLMVDLYNRYQLNKSLEKK